jgi:putative sterol carrier protein
VSSTGDARTVQYRVIVGKKDELVDGPDDADVVITVPLTDVLAGGFDPAVAYMQGRLKSTGSTGALFDLLRSGEAAGALTRLANGASRP